MNMKLFQNKYNMIVTTMPSAINQNGHDQELVETIYLGFWCFFGNIVVKKTHREKIRSPIFAILTLIASMTDFLLNINELPMVIERESIHTQNTVLETKCAAILAGIVYLNRVKKYEVRTSYNPPAILREGIEPCKRRLLLWTQILANCARCHVANPRFGEEEPTHICPRGISDIIEIGMSRILARLVSMTGRSLRYLARVHQMETAYGDYQEEKNSGIGLCFLPPEYI
jgi:hypothetical protein